MSLGSQLRYLFIILLIAASLVLASLSPPSYGCVVGILTSRIFLFILFNTGICFIITKSALGQTSAEGYGDVLKFGCCQVNEAGQKCEEMANSGSSDSSVDDGGEIDDSDGIGSDRDDEEEYDGGKEECDDHEDDDLESRVEEFIAKVILGWKQELLADKLRSSEVD